MLRCRQFVLVTVAALVLATAGCGNNNATNLLTSGIGTDIYVADTKGRADLLEDYFGLMCARAGVSLRRAGENKVHCSYTALSSEDWRNIVRASMNDIDERCDAYLETVDGARRDREKYRKQLANSETTTLAILGLKAEKVLSITTERIAVVAAAFGFARHSLDNYYSRLILEVEKSSLRSLVKKRHTAYRVKLESDYFGYVINKPSAYYAMRGYLRLCTPTSIEAEINATVVGLNYNQDGKRGNSGDEKDPELESLASMPR